MRAFLLSGVVALLTASAQADLRITEWMYDGPGGEFVEFTNVGAAPVDVTGWSFEDNNHPSGSPEYYDLSSLGIVAPGESVLLTEFDAVSFRINWNLPASVRIVDLLGDSFDHNLGRNDTINLLDASLLSVDTLQYGDQDFPGTIRTTGRSGNPLTPAALGANDPSQWTLASDGDAYGSTTSLNGELGNPGVYIPEPASLSLLALGGLLSRRR